MRPVLPAEPVVQSRKPRGHYDEVHVRVLLIQLHPLALQSPALVYFTQTSVLPFGVRVA